MVAKERLSSYGFLGRIVSLVTVAGRGSRGRNRARVSPEFVDNRTEVGERANRRNWRQTRRPHEATERTEHKGSLNHVERNQVVEEATGQPLIRLSSLTLQAEALV